MAGIQSWFCINKFLQCSNERPFCQNCIKAGKQCEGYERERVFITGTPAGKGRVASHPKRVTPPKKLKVTKIKTEETDRRDSVIQLPPLTSAWDEQLELLNGTETSSTFLTALHTGLDTVQRSNISDDGKTFGISLEPYSPPDLSPTVMDNGLWVSAQCLLCPRDADGGTTYPESYCAFLFEVNYRGGISCTHFVAFTNLCSRMCLPEPLGALPLRAWSRVSAQATLHPFPITTSLSECTDPWP